MTVPSGNDPRDRGRKSARKADQASRRFVDSGWEDYWPEDAEGAEDAAAASSKGVRRREAVESRDYRASRSGSVAAKLRFLLFGGLLIVVVLAGLYTFVRPPILRTIADWGAENPTALDLPFVADIVRGELGPSLTDPVNPTSFINVAFDIQNGDSTVDIGQKLQDAGLIADRRAFVFQAIERRVTANFIAGRHMLSRAMTLDQIIDALTIPKTSAPTVSVLFREGLRIEQMVAKLEALEANPADPSIVLKLDLQGYYDMATNPPADLVAEYPWLKLPQGASLEGFLFPATYDVPVDVTPRQLLEMQLNAFQDSAPPELVTMKPEDVYKAVQLASLVEPEAPLDTDRPLVAGVFLNRLDPKAWPTGLLNSNPTVNYANDTVWLRAHPIDTWVEYTFWKPVSGTTPLAQLTFPDDIAPYNTYHHAGLPPTPICSPGLTALQAAVNPDTADGYYYFVAKNDGTGALAFARTLAEQNANLKKYGYIP